MTNTIFALATPQGKSGVAIIRISGPNSLECANYFGIKTQLKPRYATNAILYQPQTGAVIDHVLLLYFRTPYSFTGEDILEIHCHGSKAVISEITNSLLISTLCIYAEPGEFTKRALLNNKIDLVQAEALLDLIDAETLEQKQLAQRQFSGIISQNYEELRKSVLEARAFCEVYIDFPDEDIPDNINYQINDRISNTLTIVDSMITNAKNAVRVRDGIQVAIIGVPNAGKSTLLNNLANDNVAIVSDIEGTTRDVIEVYRDINGLPFRFFDTAGIRDTDNFIESLGVNKAINVALKSDICIFLLDLTHSIEKQLDILPNVSCETIIVGNKIDLINNSLSFEKNIDLFMSANKKHSIQALEEKCLVASQQISSSSYTVAKSRHLNYLIKSHDELELSFDCEDLIIKAEHLNNASYYISSLLGKINVDDVLETLFRSFCIGK